MSAAGFQVEKVPPRRTGVSGVIVLVVLIVVDGSSLGSFVLNLASTRLSAAGCLLRVVGLQWL